MKQLFLLLALVFLLSGCGQDTPKTTTGPISTTKPSTTTPETTVPVTTAPQTTGADRMALAQSCLDQSVETLYDLIGQPDSTDYAPSCLEEGAEDGMLYYDGFVVYTLRTASGETVTFVE